VSNGDDGYRESKTDAGIGAASSLGIVERKRGVSNGDARGIT
jgi:hypothetical protein